MNQRHSLTGVLSRLSLVLILTGGSAACMAEVVDIQQSELVQRLRTGHTSLILDVRSPEEYLGGHIPGAINIPHDRLDARLAEISAHKDKEVVLYCKSGRRADIAARILQAAGFGKLLHLSGDMNAWLGNGLALSK